MRRATHDKNLVARRPPAPSQNTSLWLLATLAFALLTLPASTAASMAPDGVLTLVTDRSLLGANDSIDWVQLGNAWGNTTPSFPSPVTVQTANAHTVIASSSLGLGFLLHGQGWMWIGTFGTNDVLLRNKGSSNTWTMPCNSPNPIYNPLTLDFGASPISAGGLQIEPLYQGNYTAKIEAFDTAGNSLGTFSVPGNSPVTNNPPMNFHPQYDPNRYGSNRAIFVGVTSSVPIKRLVYTITAVGSSNGNCQYADFSVNLVSTNDNPPPPPPTPVPTLTEWGLLALVALVAGYGAWALRRRTHPLAR